MEDVRLFGTPVDKDQWITTPQAAKRILHAFVQFHQLPGGVHAGVRFGSEDAAYEEKPLARSAR